MVLMVEALSKEFGERFWEFINDGGYRNKVRSSGTPQFYRFDRPANPGFPYMIELFANTRLTLKASQEISPIHIDDSIKSLSAILLDWSYYQLFMEGKTVIDDLSVLKPSYLIPFKARAWLDLNDRRQQGEHVDSRDIRKHRNDIIRLVSELSLDNCVLPQEVKKDVKRFSDMMQLTDQDIRSLGIRNVAAADISLLLQKVYYL